jgi:hypothetical protein
MEPHSLLGGAYSVLPNAGSLARGSLWSDHKATQGQLRAAALNEADGGGSKSTVVSCA